MFGDVSARSTGGWYDLQGYGISHAGLHLSVIRDMRGKLRRKDAHVVDLGCGTGAYGELIRERFMPRIFLTAVDGYAPHLRHLRVRTCYNARITADVFDVVEGRVALHPIDCVLCMDVIEHFEKSKALDLLKWLKNQRLCYVSTPLFDFQQGEEYGNKLERHLCFFTEAELLSLGWVPVKKIPVGRGKEMGAFRNVT